MNEEARRLVELLRDEDNYNVLECIDDAADLIESLSAQLDQVTRERDAYFESMKGLCATCKHACYCIQRPGQCPDGVWQWRGVEEEG